MVGGVAFFGTPFQGTRNADLTSAVGSLIGTLSGMNTNFLHNLKTSSRELPKLTMLFNNIKTEEGIEVLVFVEKRRDGPSKVVGRIYI
jgi:predicted HTH transcriptional regulator